MQYIIATALFAFFACTAQAGFNPGALSQLDTQHEEREQEQHNRLAGIPVGPFYARSEVDRCEIKIAGISWTTGG